MDRPADLHAPDAHRLRHDRDDRAGGGGLGGNYGLVFTDTLSVPTAGTYTFYLFEQNVINVSGNPTGAIDLAWTSLITP